MKNRVFYAIAMLAALTACNKPSENFGSGEGSLTLRIGGMTKASMSSTIFLSAALYCSMCRARLWVRRSLADAIMRMALVIF